MQPIRLVIADDHPIYRQGLQTLLAGSRHLEVVGEATRGEVVLHLVETLQADVLILDVEMPGMSGIEVVKQLHEHNIAIHILVVSAYDDIEYIHRLLQAGVAGYILKEEAPEMIVQAVEAVAQGETGWFSRKVTSQFDRLDQTDPTWKDLTGREIEVLHELTLGKTNVSIGRTLGITEKTVEKHLLHIFRKLNVVSRTQAAVMALQQGLFNEKPDHS